MKTYDLAAIKEASARGKAEAEARKAAGLPRPERVTPFGSPVSKEMEQEVLALNQQIARRSPSKAKLLQGYKEEPYTPVTKKER